MNWEPSSLKTKFLPYSRQVIDEDDIEAVVRTLRSDWLTTGPKIEEFEKRFARDVDAAYAIACSSGTAALHLLYIANNIGQGDSVVIPAMTFLATANAVRHSGAEVIFSDVDPDTGLMNASHFKDAINRSTNKKVKAICPVHLNGQCVDLSSFCNEIDKIIVFEDACHSLGAFRLSRSGQKFRVGSCSLSKATMFSTHAVKAITTGEGGIITTNDENLALRLKKLRSHGVVRDKDLGNNELINLDEKNNFKQPWYYEMRELGFNYRLSDIHCALGISQLKKLKYFIERRNSLRQRYESYLKCLGKYVQPLKLVRNCTPAWHLSVALIDFDALCVSRTEVINKLRLLGIGTQVHYIPVHQQPYYRDRYGILELPGASAYYSKCLSLPLWPAMETEDVDFVMESLAKILGLKFEDNTSFDAKAN